jgi:hypothetical protein
MRRLSGGAALSESWTDQHSLGTAQRPCLSVAPVKRLSLVGGWLQAAITPHNRMYPLRTRGRDRPRIWTSRHWPPLPTRCGSPIDRRRALHAAEKLRMTHPGVDAPRCSWATPAPSQIPPGCRRARDNTSIARPIALPSAERVAHIALTASDTVYTYLSMQFKIPTSPIDYYIT